MVTRAKAAGPKAWEVDPGQDESCVRSRDPPVLLGPFISGPVPRGAGAPALGSLWLLHGTAWHVKLSILTGLALCPKPRGQGCCMARALNGGVRRPGWLDLRSRKPLHQLFVGRLQAQISVLGVISVKGNRSFASNEATHSLCIV